MKKFILKTQKKFEKYATKDGSIGKRIYTACLSALRPVYFSDEFLLMNGLKRDSKSNQQSVIFFTVNKSASTFIKKTVASLIGKDNASHIRLTAYLSPEKREKYFNNPVFMKKVFKEKGFFYGSFMSPYPFPNLEKFKVLLVLRDPRDVLTSNYFSTLFNHPLTANDMIEKRKKYADYTIDQYVLEFADDLHERYKGYCDKLLHKENVLFLKYEDMVADFKSWLQKLVAYLELKDKDKKIDELVEATKFRVEKENKKSFVRNITPGDHKNKLKPETIAKLNDLFKNELIQLGYNN
ncbi:MAG: sulfotransferase domain-containing protein [Bacteroidetes bacterium]|nr:sulfotransferase domain-containing protein [Bacteroidota bacterium]